MDLPALSIPLIQEKMGGMEQLARAVRQARLAKGMRGIDLAQRIGKDPSYVTKLEHGTLKEVPDPATLRALADAIGLGEPILLELIGYRVRAEADAPAIVDARLQNIIDAWPTLHPAVQAAMTQLLDMPRLDADEQVIARMVR